MNFVACHHHGHHLTLILCLGRAVHRTDVSVGPLGAALCSLLGNTDVCKFISDTQIILGGTPDIHLAEILGSRGPAAALCLQNAGILLKTVGE